MFYDRLAGRKPVTEAAGGAFAQRPRDPARRIMNRHNPPLIRKVKQTMAVVVGYFESRLF